MKKGKFLKLFAILFGCVALSTSFVGTTFAKYASSSTGSDTARVAKWDIQLQGANWSNTVNFNLFDYTDANVQSLGSDKVIAPGTEGSFTFTVENNSEVTAKYKIDLAITNAGNIPLEFKVGDGEWAAASTTVSVVPETQLAIGSDAQETTVQWRWVFEGDHTALGTAGTATITVAATITAEQVN